MIGYTPCDADEIDVAKVSQILEQNCGSCHQDSDDGGIDYITNLSRLVERKKIVAGSAKKSRIWLRMHDAADPMPPDGESPRPTPAEIELVGKWIDSINDTSASDVPVKKVEPIVQPPVDIPPAERKLVSTTQVIGTIHEYLSKADPEDRPYKRFFVLNHLHNMPLPSDEHPRGLTPKHLDQVRAAVSKTINSLSWSPDIVVPRPIDTDKTVMVIDLRDFGWNENRRKGHPDLWNILLQEYPYAMTHQQYPSSSASEYRCQEIYRWTGINFPWVRADWFVATATQPHFYHALLFDAVYSDIRHRQPQTVEHADAKERVEQPMTADDLYDILRVDLMGNLRRGRVARAGFTRSGVSSQPRLLERVSALFGYMWGSYDFKRGNSTMNLNARPLGPDGAFNERYADQSFQHDGGEIIFGLPNGMHGYLLLTGEGERIPFGPVDIVEDRAKTLGNGIIVNGLSCIACHKQGLIEDFGDEIRFGINGLPPDSRKLARKIYLDRPDLDQLIAKDQARYREALIAAVGPFVDQSTLAEMENGGPLIEPVGPVAKRFLVATLDLDTVAAELGVEPAKLKAVTELHDGLQLLGLSTVVNGGTTNREIWQSGSGMSMFQKASQILKTGTPGAFQAPPWRGR